MGRPGAVPGAVGTRRSRKRRIGAEVDRCLARRRLSEIRREPAAAVDASLSP